MIAKSIPGEGGDALAARTMAHAVVNAALAKAQGNNALAGAAGAATAEMMAPAIVAGLGWDQDNLSETQKQTVSTLSTLAAGLAGGLAGGSTESAVSGAQAGKTTVDYNWLHAEEKSALEAARENLSSKDPSVRDKAEKEEKRLVVLSVERDKDVIAACSGPGAASEACKQKRTEAVLAQMGYEDGPYNSKYKDAYPDEYQHISDILNATSQKTQDQLAIRDAVAQNLAEKDDISLDAAYAKYDRYTATRDVIAIVSGTLGGRELSSSSGSVPKQNLANGAKGNNDGLVPEGAGVGHTGSVGTELPSNVNLSVGMGGSKGSPIPVKDPVTANNGLNYQSNPKHSINPPRNAGIEPKNSLSLFEHSVSVNAKNQKARYTMDESGNIHQFMPDNTGNWHWAGSTADTRNPLILPNDIKSALKTTRLENQMIIGDDFFKISFQMEFMISDYSSPSGMFNFVIEEKLIPGEGVAVDLYVVISSLKESLVDNLIEITSDVGDIDLDELDFSEGAPTNMIWLDTGVAEISGRGYWFYLGFDGGEERLIFTENAGKSYREVRYARGTIKKLIENLPDPNEIKIIKRNEMILLTDLRS